jgi:hypothetical protein
MKRYRNIKLIDEEGKDLDEYMREIQERRKQEAKAVEVSSVQEEYTVENSRN